MSKPPAGHLLLRRTYLSEDQEAFACLSGDRNPVHMDPVGARRTLVGATVVHGVNLALTALETLLEHLASRGMAPRPVTAFSARFSAPVPVGENAAFYLAEETPETCLVSGVAGGAAAFRVSVHFGAGELPRDNAPPPPVSEPLVEAVFEELAGAEGALPAGLDMELARRLFPGAASCLGAAGLAEVLALTRLVGMRCPGLHSLFGHFDVRLDGSGPAGSLAWSVAKSDDRFQSLTIKVAGSGINGSLQAFVRPPPQRQPGIAEVARMVSPGSFAGSVALIVGGSRGLGEITAKIIAAGGGLPLITCFQGSADAEQVAENIRAWGGQCEVVPLDVRRCASVLRRLFRRPHPPRSICYFATPKIFGPRRGFFDHGKLARFNEYYVHAFGRIIDTAADLAGDGLRVFYPSSIAVAENMREMAEYAMSKRTAEDLCAFYNRHSENVRITVERLPRIKTDQTSTLLDVPAENALDVMLPIVRAIEEKMPGKQD